MKPTFQHSTAFTINLKLQFQWQKLHREVPNMCHTARVQWSGAATIRLKEKLNFGNDLKKKNPV